ncbi:hypothetical protein D9M68_972360 [compost metagenome]
MHGVAHQTHALVGVKALHRLHQADIALLNQVAVWQAITQVLAGDRHHQAQVRHHQLAGGLQVVVVAQAARGLLLFVQREQRQAVDRGNISIQVAQGRHQRPWVRNSDLATGNGGNGGK